MKSPFALTGALSVNINDGVDSAVIHEKIATQVAYYKAVVPGWGSLSDAEKFCIAKMMHKEEIARLKSVADQLKQGYRYR